MKGKTTLRKWAGTLAAALMMMGATTANAQSGPSLYLGGMVVPQFTNFTSNYGKYSGSIGFQAGAAAELRFSPYFSAELDALVSLHSVYRAEHDSLMAVGYFTTNYYYNTTEHAMYVQVPLLAKLNIPLSGKRIIPYDLANNNPTSISIFAGPYIGYLLSYSRSGKIREVTTDANTGELISDSTLSASLTSSDLNGIEKIDFGVTAGAGVNFGIGDKSTLSFEARFSKGFNPLDKGYFGYYTYYADANGNPMLKYHYANITNMQLGLAIVFKGKI
jgi:hypothetical protein